MKAQHREDTIGQYATEMINITFSMIVKWAKQKIFAIKTHTS
jgi:hypothetical protein